MARRPAEWVGSARLRVHGLRMQKCVVPVKRCCKNVWFKPCFSNCVSKTPEAAPTNQPILESKTESFH